MVENARFSRRKRKNQRKQHFKLCHLFCFNSHSASLPSHCQMGNIQRLLFIIYYRKGFNYFFIFIFFFFWNKQCTPLIPFIKIQSQIQTNNIKGILYPSCKDVTRSPEQTVRNKNREEEINQPETTISIIRLQKDRKLSNGNHPAIR